MTEPQRFPPQERRLLLVTPGIGPKVVERLEAAGFASLSALRAAGADAVTERAVAQQGCDAWRNRRRAIARALVASAAATGGASI
jgi:hypothetical protein